MGADQRERQIDFGHQVADDALHAGLSRDREPVDIGPAQQDGVRAKGERLDDVGAAPDAAVINSTALSPSASRTSTSASSAATAPSTWRPPWLETMTP